MVAFLKKIIHKVRKFLMPKFKFGNLLSYDSGRVEIKNVMDGLLRVLLYTCPTILVISAVITHLQNNSIWFILAFALTVIVIFVHVGLYIYFAIKDPDRLQTEKFQLDKITQQLVAYSKQQPIIKDTTVKISNEESIKIEDIKTEETEEIEVK